MVRRASGRLAGKCGWCGGPPFGGCPVARHSSRSDHERAVFSWSCLDAPVNANASSDRPGPSLPVGTVTFLLTDVESSTRQWESDPDSTAAAIRKHYEVLDDAIAAHNG